MEKIELNETPIRTSKNFKINNIKLKNIVIPEVLGNFENIKIKDEKSEVSQNINKYDLKYGLNEILDNQKTNKNIEINIKKSKDIRIDFGFNNENKNLVENIIINAENNAKTDVIIKYESINNTENFHNGKIIVKAKENSELNIIILNFMNKNSNNFLTVENNIEKNADVKYTIIDFGGKNTITNYFSNIIGESANNKLDTIYLGNDEQIIDLNYIGELLGEKSNIDIEVQGVLKDKSKKHFKGTIDFKKGAKKATGNENEYCMLLSKEAKSIALPMLLCTEEDVEGNHSTSSGRVNQIELFYMKSRGIEEKDALKLIIKANFNKILVNIKDEEIKAEILKKIDERLD